MARNKFIEEEFSGNTLCAGERTEYNVYRSLWLRKCGRDCSQCEMNAVAKIRVLTNATLENTANCLSNKLDFYPAARIDINRAGNRGAALAPTCETTPV